MTIRKVILNAARALEAAGVPDPRVDAELLLAFVTDMPRLQLRLNGETELTYEQEQRFSSLLLSRVRREPLQYLLGTQNFYGLDFKVDARALIPRQETETLCELGLAHLKALKSPTALDLCTGSGALAVVMAHECPHASVTALDISAEALALARENAALNGVAPRFLAGDLLSPVVGERFDLILSNPPYIPSQECLTLQAEVMREPRLALDGGTDGLDFYRRIARQAPSCLTPRGMLAVEIGDGQSAAVAELFARGGLSRVSVHSDLYGKPRVVSGYAGDFT